jgi:hypothetical protein
MEINSIISTSEKNPLENIEVWFHKVKNPNNEIIIAKNSIVYNGYFIDANILSYLEELVKGKVPIYSKLYFKLMKICFLVTKENNILIPNLALWERSKIEKYLPFPDAEINKDRLIELLEIVFLCQSLDDSVLINYDISFSKSKLKRLLNFYDADNAKDAARIYLERMHFHEMVEECKKNFSIKIDINFQYLMLCYEAHKQVSNNRSQDSKVKIFIDLLNSANLPLVTKTLNFCLRTLSDSLSNGDLKFKYKTEINGYRAIHPDKSKSTAVDLFLSDYAYLINGYIDEGISYNTTFVTSDKVAVMVEDDVSSCMVHSENGLPLRYDFKPQFDYLKKSDKKVVDEYINIKTK